MAQNLFALSANSAATDTNQKPLVAFRAGKCTFANNTVTPIPKKGTVQLTQTPDSLIHFQWKDRTSGTVDDDLIIFPEDAVFSKVTQGTTGRVFILKFKTSERKLFFWMQEPSDDKDKEYEEKINQYINTPPVPGESTSGAVDTPEPPLLTPLPLPQSVSSHESSSTAHTSPVSGNTILQQHGPSTARPAPTANATTSATPNATSSSTPNPAPSAAVPAQQLNLADIDLSSVLANYGIQSGNQNIDLLDLLSLENLLPILTSDPTIVQTLCAHLPEEERNNGLTAIRELFYSAQFQQSVSMFEQIVSSGQGNELLQQFGVDPRSAGPFGVLDLNGFFKALQQKFEKNK